MLNVDKIKFLPFLFLYISIVLYASFSSSYINFANRQTEDFLISEDATVDTDHFVYDEKHYVKYAKNLSNGYYSPPGNISLWAGPGYPIVLVPFIFLKLPWIVAKLMNPIFMYMAILYFYYTLRFYVNERTALFSSVILAINPPFLRYMPHLMTEVFVIFLVCGFIYHYCRFYHEGGSSKRQLLISSVYLGYLALTKVFFGYVILTGLILFSILFLMKKRRELKYSLLIYVLALVCCLPYLFYTYSLTGRIFYWANSGGLSLYWMASPYHDELGDWRSVKEVFGNPSLKNHRPFFDEISKLSGLQKDDALTKRAIHNIINNPFKYFENWVANIGRMLFHYPYTSRPPDIKIYYFGGMIPGMFLTVLSVLCIYPSYLGRKIIPYEIFTLLLFSVIAFAGSSLLSAYNRQLQPIVPICALWIFFTLFRVMKIEIRK